MFDIFGILATPLGYAMKFLYDIVGNYGWAIIIFTVLVRLVLFPLSLKQQKSTARTQAYQPMIQEIQKKWANDKQRQQQEMQKFYEENNIKMSAGCLPMIVNMLVLFGMIAVIQSPLTHVLHLADTEVNLGYAIIQQTTDYDISSGNSQYTRQSIFIDSIKNEDLRVYFEEGTEVPVFNELPVVLAEGQYIGEDNKLYNDKNEVVQSSVVNEAGETVTIDTEVTWENRKLGAETIQSVSNFNFRFLGLNMADAPVFSLDMWYTLIMPVLSLLTMVLSQVIVMKTSGQTQNKGQMLIMTVLFGALFAFYAFRVPAGFSLYYTMSNIVMTVQQLVVRKIYDPAKITEEIKAEMEAKKNAKKAKKKIVVKDESGQVIDRELSEAELSKLRLAKARELDAKRYSEDSDEAEKEDDSEERAEKARQMDEDRYGDDAKTGDADAEEVEAETEETQQEAKQDKEEYSLESSQAKEAYKPGRRKRAKQNKEDSFAGREQAAEKHSEDTDKEDE